MKTKHLKSGIILSLFLLFSTQISYAKKSEVSQSKTITKNFKVSQNQLLSIDNKFGDVNITTWDKKEISVEIKITVGSSNEEKAKKRLDEITVEINESSDKISFKTEIGNKVQNASGKNSMEINYEVKMPKSNPLDLKNSFGAFTINDLDGKAKIDVDFGSASIGKINHPESELTFKFSKPVQIEHIENGKLTVKYSNLKLGTATKLKLDAEFGENEIEGIKELEMDLKFGELKLGQADVVDIHSNMSGIKIGTLVKSGKFRPKYGSLKIDMVSNKMTNLEVDGEFSPIEIKIEKGASFAIEVASSMAGIEVPTMVWEEHDKSNHKESYKGKVGSGSGNAVNIKSSFGAVELQY